MVGLGRFELPTSRLSGVRSNQLSYRPFVKLTSLSVVQLDNLKKIVGITICRFDLDVSCLMPKHLTYNLLLRKEVIQPQVPLRLPCYDFTPITNHTVGVCLLYK